MVMMMPYFGFTGKHYINHCRGLHSPLPSVLSFHALYIHSLCSTCLVDRLRQTEGFSLSPKPMLSLLLQCERL
ncbi:UNVERIFIED_CONTAM: hypothetical protein FKN15_068004 [Acipenser sinensis]